LRRREKGNTTMHCSVEELKAKLDAGEDILLLDVRTDDELEIVKLDRCTHVPLHEIEDRVGELEAWKDKEVICMCHHGGRSAAAQEFLQSQGFNNVLNLTGGIHEYATQVDSSLPTY